MDSRVFDIRDYGYREGEDATAAIQAAMDAAREGDTIVLPRGSHRLAATIALLKRIRIRGER